MRIWHSGPEIDKNLDKLITFFLCIFFQTQFRFNNPRNPILRSKLHKKAVKTLNFENFGKKKI
jgi:hypothetical protein